MVGINNQNMGAWFVIALPFLRRLVPPFPTQKLMNPRGLGIHERVMQETLHHGNERRIAARNPTEPQTAANLQKYTKIIRNYRIPRRNLRKNWVAGFIFNKSRESVVSRVF